MERPAPPDLHVADSRRWRAGWAVLQFIALLVGMCAIAGSAERPRESDPVAIRTVEICTDIIADGVLLGQARAIASYAFANIGIRIEWRRGRRSCGPRGIIIGVRESTPDELLPEALGFSLPFGGVYGEVFLDRIIRLGDPDERPRLLAHALTHEITHLLEGSDQHAERGLMKRLWDSRDLYLMRRGFLEFTDADVSLLRSGVDSRSTRQAMALDGPGPLSRLVP